MKVHQWMSDIAASVNIYIYMSVRRKKWMRRRKPVWWRDSVKWHRTLLMESVWHQQLKEWRPSGQWEEGLVVCVVSEDIYVGRWKWDIDVGKCHLSSGTDLVAVCPLNYWHRLGQLEFDWNGYICHHYESDWSITHPHLISDTYPLCIRWCPPHNIDLAMALAYVTYC